MVLRAIDIHEHLKSVSTWVDWDRTCDGFKAGNPGAEVTGIAVGWQSLQSALEQGHEKGQNLFITHEPTFYSHMDDDPQAKDSPPGRRKAAFLERSGMTVYRCHDVWDRFPGRGILDSWAAFLELGEPIARAKYYGLYEIPSTTAWEVTFRTARKVAALGEQSVQFVGTKWQMVSHVAVGTGAITDVRQMLSLGEGIGRACDIVIASDDGTTLWRDAAYMADIGLPMVIVNHMTSEIPGMMQLTEYLREQFPGIPVDFVGPTCQYEICATEQVCQTPIQMRRPDLDDLPALQVPQGYTCRPLEAGEEWAYIEVMNESNYSGEVDDAWFERTFPRDPEYDPAFLLMIWEGERPVAAAAAWHLAVDGERWGLVHWVGTVRSERGKGLGRAIAVATLQKLRERGFTRALLNTADWRLPAVAAYLRVGFQPWPTERGTQEVWERVLSELDSWRKAGRRSPGR